MVGLLMIEDDHRATKQSASRSGMSAVVSEADPDASGSAFPFLTRSGHRRVGLQMSAT